MRRLLVVLAAMVIFSLSLVSFCEAVTQYRGVMISPQVKAADLQTLGAWNVNFVRWQLDWYNRPANATTFEQYDQWLEGSLTALDTLLPVCEKLGIKVLVDLHTTPGGRTSSSQNMIFNDAASQAKFIQVWNKIAHRYAANQTVWGFDLANEPVQGTVTAGLLDWHQLATVVAQNIRTMDSNHVIVIEPHNWGSPDGFIGFTPLPASITNVTYSVHMYQPHKFSHQGVDAYSNKPLRYPGVVDRKMWNKAQLRRTMQPVLDFQKKYGVKIYVGEFSAVRWAAGGSAYSYLKDVIEVFEENGWDWTYHAFREWHGWSVEHGEDKSNTTAVSKQTNREKLLRTWFGKNQKF